MSNPRTVVYQGTFDPFTAGHLSVVKQALRQFEEVIVLLLVNPHKKPLFSLQERKEIILADTASFSGVKVDSSEGLLVDYMRAHGLTICVRGVRNAQDEAWEMHNHHLSQALYPPLQTLLLPCEEQWREVSSSAVKEACRAGRLPAGWVGACAQKKLLSRYNFQ